jgi:hypothetical protein
VTTKIFLGFFYTQFNIRKIAQLCRLRKYESTTKVILFFCIAQIHGLRKDVQGS